MQYRLRKCLRKTQTDETSSFVSYPSISKSKVIDTSQEFILKDMLESIQQKLYNTYASEISQNTLHFLVFYIEYHISLTKAIKQYNGELREAYSPFLQNYSQNHSSQKFNMLFIKFMRKQRQICNLKRSYKGQCVYNYFGLDQFENGRILKTIMTRIAEFKAQGRIIYERTAVKRATPSRQLLSEQKQNRSDKPYESKSSKRIGNFLQNKLYYSMVSLKMLIRETSPNLQEVYRICEETKSNLAAIFSCVKLKKSNQASILKGRCTIFKG